MRMQVAWVGWMVLGVGLGFGASAQMKEPPEMLQARAALQAKEFARAKVLFAAYARAHKDDVQAELGVGDAELGLHEYDEAETVYRSVVAQQPELWLAHKNLVIVEAALGRWEEFDRERAVLRAARERGAPGITARESDVIDSLDVTTNAGAREHWIVREYYEPVGRSLTRYNFERFGADGRVKEYISLESAEAARRALTVGGDVTIGAAPVPQPLKDFALNFYTGAAHGTIALYPEGEPSYERVRRDVRRWLLTHAREAKGAAR